MIDDTILQCVEMLSARDKSPVKRAECVLEAVSTVMLSQAPPAQSRQFRDMMERPVVRDYLLGELAYRLTVHSPVRRKNPEEYHSPAVLRAARKNGWQPYTYALVCNDGAEAILIFPWEGSIQKWLVPTEPWGDDHVLRITGPGHALEMSSAEYMALAPGPTRTPNPPWVLPAAFALTSAVSLAGSLWDLSRTLGA